MCALVGAEPLVFVCMCTRARVSERTRVRDAAVMVVEVGGGGWWVGFRDCLPMNHRTLVRLVPLPRECGRHASLPFDMRRAGCSAHHPHVPMHRAARPKQHSETTQAWAAVPGYVRTRVRCVRGVCLRICERATALFPQRRHGWTSALHAPTQCPCWMARVPA
jgi:hypothetical protein